MRSGVSTVEAIVGTQHADKAVPELEARGPAAIGAQRAEQARRRGLLGWGFT